MNVGIDIGSTKTVIYSSQNNGSLVSDESGNREIPTVLERTKPRSFGKAVSGDKENSINLRRRLFFLDLKKPENQEDALMFLNYLERTTRLSTNYLSGCLAIPECYNEEEKLILKSIIQASGLSISSFITQLTAIATCAALTKTKIDETFMIIDCGYSKTSVGLFSFIDGKIKALNRWFLKRGGRDYDEAALQTIFQDYNIQDSIIVREKMAKHINSIKKGLNELDNAKINYLDENFNSIPIEISKAKSSEKIAEIQNDFMQFFAKIMEETKFQGYTEVVGNSSNNCFVQDILKSLNYNCTLSATESAAHGACLASWVNSRTQKYKVEEIIGTDIFMRVENEKCLPTKVFSRTSVINSEPIKVKYYRTSSFNVDIIADDNVIGVISINLEDESDSDKKKKKKIAVTLKINSFMVVEVLDVECESKISFTYKSLELSEERKNEIKAVEKSFRDDELLKTAIDKVRNYTENFVDSFDRTLNQKFPGLIDRNLSNTIEDLRTEFFGRIYALKSLEDAEAMKKDAFSTFGFISDKLVARGKEIKERITNFISEVNEIKFDYQTFSVKNLKSLIFTLNAYKQSLDLTLESAMDYNPDYLDEMESKIKNTIENIQNEQVIEKAKADKQKKKDEKANCCDVDKNCCDIDKNCCNDNEECCNDDNECCNDEKK